MKKKKALSILKGIVEKKELLDSELGRGRTGVYQLTYNEEVHKAFKKAIKVMEKEV